MREAEGEMIIEDKYVYSVTLNGIQAGLLTGLVNRGLHGRDAADVIRRILDAEFSKMVEVPKIDLLELSKAK